VVPEIIQPANACRAKAYGTHDPHDAMVVWTMMDEARAADLGGFNPQTEIDLGSAPAPGAVFRAHTEKFRAFGFTARATLQNAWRVPQRPGSGGLPNFEIRI
jgi:hypothetical protein